MLTFVTAVRHPHNSSSYERVSRLLTHTIESVVRQTDDRFQLVVVHNERPNVSVDDPRVSFVEVGFGPPSLERKADIDFMAGVMDKGAKLVVGVLAAQLDRDDYVMFLDCDDLVHRQLTEFVAAHPGTPGWYFPQGYLHTVGTRYVQLIESRFDLKCGSSGIVRRDLLPVPSSLAVDAAKEQIVEAIGAELLYQVFATSGQWERHLGPLGLQLDPLPFPGAVWQVGTGENASGNLVSNRPRESISIEITSAFALHRPSRVAAVARTAELGARRLSRRLKSKAGP